MNGPVFVEGAEPGDALRVEILRMDPVRDTGWTRGALSATVVDAEAARHLPPRDRIEWLIDREARTVRLEKPEPALERPGAAARADDRLLRRGAAAGQAISTASSDRNGGNMDYRGFGPGCTVSFPVFDAGGAVLSRRLPRGAGRRRDRRGPASRPAARSRCG